MKIPSHTRLRRIMHSGPSRFSFILLLPSERKPAGCSLSKQAREFNRRSGPSACLLIGIAYQVRVTAVAYRQAISAGTFTLAFVRVDQHTPVAIERGHG